MLFNSPEFILFYLPLVLAGFFVLARWQHEAAALWLALASLFFYGWWNPKYVLLLLASIGFNYAMGAAIAEARRLAPAGPRAQRLLLLGVGGDLLLLGYFKYANFFLDSLNRVGDLHLPLAQIILPLGISFFTFTQIAFLVDTCEGKASEGRFAHYLLFVTYFPHLVAGPVLHHKEMMPQFALPATYHLNAGHVATGLCFFMLGLAKKVMLADSLAPYASAAFGAAEAGAALTLLEAWGGALAYTFQLYFDFSGYSDMAIGLSLLFGVVLPLNFNSPYRAASIIEFWRRWHMTLSRFLRDYLYIPLGGKRHGPLRRHLNLLVTMLLGGLWHGANWTFVLWGALHGLYLIVNHLWVALRERLGLGGGGLAGRIAAHALTFVCVVCAWVLFRAETLAGAGAMLRGMAGLEGVVLPAQIAALLPGLGTLVGTRASMALLGGGTVMGVFEQVALLLLAAFIALACPNTQSLSPRARLWIVVLVSGFVIQGVFFERAPSEFLYFQF